MEEGEGEGECCAGRLTNERDGGEGRGKDGKMAVLDGDWRSREGRVPKLSHFVRIWQGRLFSDVRGKSWVLFSVLKKIHFSILEHMTTV